MISFRKFLPSVALAVMLAAPAAAQSLVWTQLPNTNIPTGDGLGSAALNGKMYSINRWYNSVSYNEVYYSTNGYSWTPSAVPRPFPGAHNIPTIVHQGRIFLIGGDFSSGYQPHIYSWDGLEPPLSTGWRADEVNFPALNRVGHFGFSTGSEICFGGGQTMTPTTPPPTKVFTDLWCSSTGENGTWQQVATDLPINNKAFISGNLPVIDGEAYLIAGGFYSTSDYPNREWTNTVIAIGGSPNYRVRMVNPKNQMPPMFYNAVGEMNGILLSIAGHNGSNLSTVYALYDKGRTLVRLPDFPGPADHALTAQNYNGSFYVWGGLVGGQRAWRLDYVDLSKIHTGQPPNGTTNMTDQYTVCDLSQELTPGKTVASVGIYLNGARQVRQRIGYRSAPGVFDTVYRAPTTTLHAGGSQYQDFPVGNFVVPGSGYYVCFTLAYGPGTPDVFSFGAYSRAMVAGDVTGNGIAFSEPNDGTLPMRWTEQ